jgi:predicted RNase H-like HicB family nuclease
MTVAQISESIADRVGLDWENPKSAYQCRVLLIPEDDGEFSAIGLDLPGVASQGSNPQEAIANFKDAFSATAAEYISSGTAIPWAEDVDVSDAPKGSKTLWILVDV